MRWYSFSSPFALLFIVLIMTLSGCDKKNKVPIEGSRETVLLNMEVLKPDERAKDIPIALQQAVENKDWPQSSGNASHAMTPVALGDNLQLIWNIGSGSGSGGENRLINGPLVAEGKVFTIDTTGVVRAFALSDGHELWSIDSTPDSSSVQPFSGGLAYHNGALFAATASAKVLCLDPNDGSIEWESPVNAPVRAPPAVSNNQVYVVSINNQLDVLDIKTGKILWSHNGVMESAGLLGGSSPAIKDDVVIVPYTSGEVFALKATNGYQLWSENLTSFTRLDSVSSLAHIKARPVIDNGKVFLVSHGGKISALDLRNGQTVWSKDIGGIRSPAVSGGVLFLLTNDNELVCLTQDEGLVIWTKILPRFEDPENNKDKILWAGPILASNNRLILSGSNGKVLIISAQDGSEKGSLPLPQGSLLSPIVADKTLLILTNDAELIAFR